MRKLPGTTTTSYPASRSFWAFAGSRDRRQDVRVLQGSEIVSFVGDYLFAALKAKYDFGKDGITVVDENGKIVGFRGLRVTAPGEAKGDAQVRVGR